MEVMADAVVKYLLTLFTVLRLLQYGLKATLCAYLAMYHSAWAVQRHHQCYNLYYSTAADHSKCIITYNALVAVF